MRGRVFSTRIYVIKTENRAVTEKGIYKSKLLSFQTMWKHTKNRTAQDLCSLSGGVLSNIDARLLSTTFLYKVENRPSVVDVLVPFLLNKYKNLFNEKG